MFSNSDKRFISERIVRAEEEKKEDHREKSNDEKGMINAVSKLFKCEIKYSIAKDGTRVI